MEKYDKGERWDWRGKVGRLEENLEGKGNEVIGGMIGMEGLLNSSKESFVKNRTKKFRSAR